MKKVLMICLAFCLFRVPALAFVRFDDSDAYNNYLQASDLIQASGVSLNADDYWSYDGVAYTFVTELPDGLHTIIGEKGHGLSEGQAQRIAIARAFLRPAPILILDEATSALDESTELEILRQIKNRCTTQTCLVISHRNIITEFADQVIHL